MYSYRFIRIILKYFGQLVLPISILLNKKYLNFPSNYDPIFIIGPPRSGTTILYQLITNFINVLYTDNIVFLSRENPFLGFTLSHLFFKNKPHNSFQSFYGNTLNEGLHAPNQTPVFWIKYRDYIFNNKVATQNITVKTKLNISNNLYSIINKYNKPFISKGSEITNNLYLFHQIFPKAKFIIIKRDPFFIAQSLFLSTDKLGKFENVWLKTLQPYNLEEVSNLNVYEKIILFIYNIYESIYKFAEKVNPKYIEIIDYNNLVNYKETLAKLSVFFGKSVNYKTDFNTSKYDFKIANKIRIDKNTESEFRKIISNYKWRF